MSTAGVSRPLDGRRVAITRPDHSAASWVDALEGVGAQVMVCPAILIAPPTAWQPFDDALRDVHRYDWIAITSANAVRALAERWRTVHDTAPFPDRPRLAAVGGATGRAIEHYLRTVDFIPETHTAHGLATELPAAAGAHVLFPAGDLAGDDLEHALTRRGIAVTRVKAYRTTRAPGLSALAAALGTATVDAVLFSSPSSVRFVADALAEMGSSMTSAFGAGRTVAICIGPVTGAAARAHGAGAIAIAPSETSDALIETLRRAFAASG
jgi:uroporphyrinogen-III synthase